MRCVLTSIFADYYSQAHSSLTDYNARRPSQNPVYLQNTLPGAADPHFQQPYAAYDRQSDHMDLGASAFYQPCATLEPTLSTYNDFELRKALHVSFYTPKSGTQGTQIYISLDSSTDLLSSTHTIASLMFATYPVHATLTFDSLEDGDQGVRYKYSVSAIAPAFSETRSLNSTVPLCLQLQQSRLDGELVKMDDWTYEDRKQFEHYSSPQLLSRKRKVDELLDTAQSTKRVKRVTASEQQTTQSQGYGSNPYLPASLDISKMQKRYTAYGRSQLQQRPQNESDTMPSKDLLSDPSNPQYLLRPSMGQTTSSWSPSYGAEPHSGRNARMNVSQSLPVSSASSPPSPTNPKLDRTTEILSRSRGTTLCPNPVLFDIRGNLSTVQDNWTSEECAVKRRIVHFWREQRGATLSAHFRPLKADEHPSPYVTNGRRVSCIYWEERKKYYITSVDTIRLLGSLVGLHFEGAEKNRIRRNVDNFKTCTVSKDNQDTASFHEVLVRLPDPKPWKINKPVKVFEWNALGEALKKVISKYVSSMLFEETCITDLSQSVDPSSTAGSPASHISPNLSRTQSEGGTSRHSALSSRSTANSTASAVYSQRSKSSTLSPPSIPNGLPNYSQASPLQQYSAPNYTHFYTTQTPGSQYTDTFDWPYAAHVSIPSLSSTHTASTVGNHRSSNAPTENMLASTDYYTRPSHTISSFASQYAPQESRDGPVPVGLPGRASLDLSPYHNSDLSSSGGVGDARYGLDTDVDDSPEISRYKQELFKLDEAHKKHELFKQEYSKQE